MALPALDAFTGTDGTTLPAYRPNWVSVLNGTDIQIQSNRFRVVTGPVSTTPICMWGGDVFRDDHYAQVRIVKAGTGNVIGGPATRCSTSGGGNAYFGNATIAGAGVTFNKLVAGTATFLSFTSAAVADGDLLRFESRGSSHIILLNGVAIKTTTDTALTSGAPGVCSHFGADNTPETDGDDFQGSDVTPSYPGPFGFPKLPLQGASL